MTDEELIAYFENAGLPEILRVDRATTQHELPYYVRFYVEKLKEKPGEKNIRFWLERIKKRSMSLSWFVIFLVLVIK